MTTTVRREMYMSDSDAFSWYMEADPLLRSTVVSVMVLDGAPVMDRLLERADRATRMAPGFRHKVVQAPSRLANPRWIVDPDFDLTFHVRRISAPARRGAPQRGAGRGLRARRRDVGAGRDQEHGLQSDRRAPGRDRARRLGRADRPARALDPLDRDAGPAPCVALRHHHHAARG